MFELDEQPSRPIPSQMSLVPKSKVVGVDVFDNVIFNFVPMQL